MENTQTKWPTWQEVIDFLEKERNRPYVPPSPLTVYISLETHREMQADPNHWLWFGSNKKDEPAL